MIKQQLKNIQTAVLTAFQNIKAKVQKGVLLVQAEFILIKEKIKQSVKKIKEYLKSWTK